MSASYAISVRRAGVLPAASFRFRVTPDTLAVRLTVPTIRVRRGLAPPSHKSATTADLMTLVRHAPCRAHTEKSPGNFPGLLISSHGIEGCRPGIAPRTGGCALCRYRG